MLSPLPEIQEDCKANETGYHRSAVERVIARIFYKLPREEIHCRKDLFWVEWMQFTSRTGPYAKKHIWGSCLLDRYESHLWHRQYSVPYTEVLGKIACLVTSKNLGIGDAERAWKTTKRIKCGNRANITAERTKKQSTLHHAASLLMAESRAKEDGAKGLLWTNEDEAFQKDIGSKDEVTTSKFVCCILHCFAYAMLTTLCFVTLHPKCQ